MFHFVLLLLHT